MSMLVLKAIPHHIQCQSSISAGDQIWTRYTTPQLGSSQRVRDLQQTWHFVCGCQRCTDPTELGESGAQPVVTVVSHILYSDAGSMMSAVKCVLCPAGYLLPKVPTVIGDS